MASRILASLVVLAATSVAIAGCGNSPGALCQGTVDRINAMLDRCDYPGHIRLVNAEGEDTDCGFAARVTNPDEIVQVCWPWLESVECGDLMEGEPGRPLLDPSCEISSHFQGY